MPFAANSLDLVVLPHTLELHADPHATLREVERVLVPEGRVVICGINPVSLWGLRQRRAHLYRRLGWGSLYLPQEGEFIGYWRMRDWLRLLSFEVESGPFGCYRPAVCDADWLERFQWMDVQATLVAHPGGGLFSGGGQAGARHAPVGAGLEGSRPVPWPMRPGVDRQCGPMRRNDGETPHPPLSCERSNGRWCANCGSYPKLEHKHVNQIEIYTDGACKGNPGPGGWGALLLSGGPRRSCLAARSRPPTTGWN